MSDVILNTAGRYGASDTRLAGAQSGQANHDRWPPGRSLRFVVFSSLALWAVIIGAAVSLF